MQAKTRNVEHRKLVVNFSDCCPHLSAQRHRVTRRAHHKHIVEGLLILNLKNRAINAAVGFSFRAEGIKIGLVTDLGYIPDSIKFHLHGSHVLMLESNHDLDMLKVGPYPWAVKQRVMSRNGHLSNDVVGDFVGHEFDSGTATLVLGHLSEHNNHPEIVRMVAQQALDRRGLATRLVVANQREPTEVFRF